MPNLWKTGSVRGKHDPLVRVGEGFGGYPDWTYEYYDSKVSIRNDHENDARPLIVGTHGRCICCAKKISKFLYCDVCCDNYDYKCEHCDCGLTEEDTCAVFDRNGNSFYVCEDCRDEYFTYCECCGDYYENDYVTEISCGYYVCHECLDRRYTYCDECEEYFPNDEVTLAIDERGNTIDVCNDCLDQHYTRCEQCDEYIHNNLIESAIDPDTEEMVHVCPDCHKEYYAIEMKVEETV